MFSQQRPRKAQQESTTAHYHLICVHEQPGIISPSPKAAAAPSSVWLYVCSHCVRRCHSHTVPDMHPSPLSRLMVKGQQPCSGGGHRTSVQRNARGNRQCLCTRRHQNIHLRHLARRCTYVSTRQTPPAVCQAQVNHTAQAAL